MAQASAVPNAACSCRGSSACRQYAEAAGVPSQGELWIIDVSQSVDLDHPRALDFLREDALHVNDFFRKAGVATLTVRELFDFVVDPHINPGNIDAAVDALIRVASSRPAVQDPEDAMADKVRVLRPDTLSWPMRARCAGTVACLQCLSCYCRLFVHAGTRCRCIGFLCPHARSSVAQNLQSTEDVHAVGIESSLC